MRGCFIDILKHLSGRAYYEFVRNCRLVSGEHNVARKEFDLGQWCCFNHIHSWLDYKIVLKLIFKLQGLI